jgi:hypothetical protein
MVTPPPATRLAPFAKIVFVILGATPVVPIVIPVPAAKVGVLELRVTAPFPVAGDIVNPPPLMIWVTDDDIVL